jgi:hypothetical protein
MYPCLCVRVNPFMPAREAGSSCGRGAVGPAELCFSGNAITAEIVPMGDTQSLFPADAADMEPFARTARLSMQEERDG